MKPTFLFYLIFFFVVSCQQKEKGLLFPPTSFVPSTDMKMVQIASTDTTGGNIDKVSIPAGETKIVFNEKGPGVISRIWFTHDIIGSPDVRKLLLRMYWDNEETPSVEVPLDDFFGCGAGFKHHTPRFIGMSSGGYYCYFPMPFQKNGRIELVNQTNEELYSFYYHIDYYQVKNVKNMPYFHAIWKRDPRTTSSKNFVLLEAKGEGFFAGANFYGENKPSIEGTGFEDYFSGAWYFRDGEFDASYHGLTLKNDSAGIIAAYRYHIPDAIPFKESIKVSYEHGHNNESVVDYCMTGYWYQTEPHASNYRIPEAGKRIYARRKVPVDAINVEDCSIKGGKFTIAETNELGIEWSNDNQVLLSENKPYDITINNLREKAYDVSIYPTDGEQYSSFKVLSNGKVSGNFNTREKEVFPSAPIVIKNVPVINQQLTLTVIPDINKTKKMTGLDVFHLEPVREFIDSWNIIGPFPNKRLNDKIRYGLGEVYPPEKEIDLTKTYQGLDQIIGWRKLSGMKNTPVLKLARYFKPSDFVVVYFSVFIWSPENQKVPLLLGSDDGSKVFLNQKELFRVLDIRMAQVDDDEIQLPLNKGWNTLLVKVENNYGGFGLSSRIIDTNDNLKITINKNNIIK